jgi:hypothetical protein
MNRIRLKYLPGLYCNWITTGAADQYHNIEEIQFQSLMKMLKTRIYEQHYID